VPVKRSSQLNQAVRIPSGEWTVTFHYQPWWKLPTLCIAGLSLVLSLFFLVLPDPSQR